MTLDEAIDDYEFKAEFYGDTADEELAYEYGKIAEWLRELREARMVIDLLKILRDGFKEDAQEYKAENTKLRKSVRSLLTCIKHEECDESCPNYGPMYADYGYEKNGSIVVESEYLGCCAVGLENCNSMLFDTDEYLRKLGIEPES